MKCHLTILNEVSALIQIASSIKKLTIRCYPLWVASLCILCSCSFRSDEYKLQYKVAHGYFVKNDIPCSQIPPCIDSKEKFDDLFGMAAVMGEDGVPTAIDFSRQMVLPLVLQPTDTTTHILIKNVCKKGNKINVTCLVEKGDVQSYAAMPCELIVIEKKDFAPDDELNIRYQNAENLRQRNETYK